MPQPLAKSPLAAAPSSPVARPSSGPILPLGTDSVVWTESPARLLHERLVATFAPPVEAARPETLSPRAKLAILVGSSAMLWLAIGLAAAAIA